MAEPAFRQRAIEERWSFLEEEREACCLVSRRMELLYLNVPARALVSDDWFGRRCWERFPVASETCVAACAAVRAVNQASEITCCEEYLYPEDASPVRVAIAVIPLNSQADGAQALLLFRPKDADVDEAVFEQSLVDDAVSLLERTCWQLPDKPA